MSSRFKRKRTEIRRSKAVSTLLQRQRGGAYCAYTWISFIYALPSEQGMAHNGSTSSYLGLTCSPLTCVLEFTSMLLDIMLEFHAWSAARPRGESEHSGQLIEQRIGKVMAIEMEQGRSSTSTALSRAYSIPFPFLHSTLIGRRRFIAWGVAPRPFGLHIWDPIAPSLSPPTLGSIWLTFHVPRGYEETSQRFHQAGQAGTRCVNGNSTVTFTLSLAAGSALATYCSLDEFYTLLTISASPENQRLFLLSLYTPCIWTPMRLLSSVTHCCRALVSFCLRSYYTTLAITYRVPIFP